MASSTLRLQTMALLRSQLLSRALQQGGSLDSVLYEALFAPQRHSAGRQTSGAALTGRIRGDAGMLRQASKNASEGGSILETAATAIKSISNALTRMQALAQGVTDGSLTPDAQTEYSTLAAGIAGTIASTAYNGISLLNGAAWAADERLSVSGSGLQKTAALTIQTGMGSAPLALHDLSSLPDALAGTDLNNASDAAAAAATVSGLSATVNTLARSYEAQAGGFASEAGSLNRQADILLETAARAQQSPGLDAAALLLDLLLADKGRILIRFS